MSFHEEEDNNPFSPPIGTPSNSIHSTFQSSTNSEEDNQADTEITQPSRSPDEDGFTDLPLDDEDENTQKRNTDRGVGGTTLGEPTVVNDTNHTNHKNTFHSADGSQGLKEEAEQKENGINDENIQNEQNGSNNKQKNLILQTTVAYDPEIYPANASTTTAANSLTTSADINAEEIEITEASQTHEGAHRSYTVYTISYNSVFVRRRYSEFESLRQTLTKLHPTLIIPPIPEKQSLSIKEITASVKGKKKDAEIEHRRRMLLVFLKRCLKIREVRESQWLHKFLDPNYNWSEVLRSPELVQLPKNPLLAHPLDPVGSSVEGHVRLPLPSVMNPGFQNLGDSVFHSSEQTAKEYEELITNGISKTHKRLTRHLSHLSTEYSELGAALNTFSLSDPSLELASFLESTGQNYDTSHLHVATLSSTLIREFNEPIEESTQFAGILRDLLKFRQMKALQLDILTRSLKVKISKLRELEALEVQAGKLDQALAENQAKTGKINFDRKKASTNDSTNGEQTSSGSATAAAAASGYKLKIPSLSSISTYITKQIDPSTATTHSPNSTLPRPEQIRLLKTEIRSLKETYTISNSDVKLTDEAVMKELQRFQTEKNKELKEILKKYCDAVLEWAKGECEIWKDLRAGF